MNVVRFALKRLLLSMNLDVRRIGGTPASFHRLGELNPITFQYLSDLKITPFLTIELPQARAGVMGFSYSPASAHPLARAFQAARGGTNNRVRMDAVRAVLSDYYGLVRPSSAFEVVDLTPDDAPGLAGIPRHSWVMPWSEQSVEDIATHRRICLEEEGLLKGVFVSLEDGATLYGPVSEKKLGLETERVLTLARSIEAKGFQPNENHRIEVMGLRSGAEYRWFVVQGQHRLAACAAFDIMQVPARLNRIIRREDAEFWPHVVSGTFTLTGALKCFDRLFAGKVAACAAFWLSPSLKKKRVEHEPLSAS
jgi:hypothetical protein